MQFREALRKYLGIPDHIMRHLFFHRDPYREIKTDQNLLISPADGTVLYAHENIDANLDLVDVKGIKVSPNSILQGEYLKGNVLIVGIFMSFWDVHVNRMPSNGIIDYEFIDPNNGKLCTMIDVENALCDSRKQPLVDCEYLLKNARIMNKITTGDLHYFVVQIADAEVDVLVPFYPPGTALEQGDRFGLIRWGSQVDVIIPQEQSRKFRVAVKPGDHIKAGLDAIARISPREMK